ncbi:hypothetical protein IPA_03240 [Ignicoccus pacificus DSM 13166]|uniref:Uncharacterized protein n=1 Tax=Ignicoccus pacificus DSM 13166 TaxID=940294 RepID=A0A977PLA2_9CREN|nr:hypothetical protein IPA_03240 [Ignicoccus pacificus DSM 13166]
MRILPQEPSAAGFMIVSFLYMLILTPLPLYLIPVAMTLLLIHLSTFDETFRRLKISPKEAAPYLALNIIPYLVLPLFVKVNLVVLVIPAIIIFLYLYLFKSRDNPHAYILGSSIPTLTSFIIIYLSPKVTLTQLVFWYALAIYVSATAAYIESKLPWRKVDPRTALAVWGLSLPVFIFKPCSLIAFIEPTIKFVRNVLNNVKVNPKELKRFGWKEMSRFMLYSTLLLILFKVF